MPTPKEDAEKLMGELLPFAEEMLRQHQEFYPYGGYMADEGKITHVGGKIEGTEHPKSQQIIDLLTESFRADAGTGKFKATAIIFDVRIKIPKTETVSDAIQINLDHRDNYSARVYFPYQIENGNLEIGSPFAQRGEGKIFGNIGL